MKLRRSTWGNSQILRSSVNTESPRYHEESFMEEMGIHLEEWKNGHGVAADIKQFQNQDRMTVFCIMEKGDMTIQFRKLLTIYSRYYIKAVLGISDIVESVRELWLLTARAWKRSNTVFFTDRSLICYSTVREEIQSSLRICLIGTGIWKEYEAWRECELRHLPMIFCHMFIRQSHLRSLYALLFLLFYWRQFVR